MRLRSLQIFGFVVISTMSFGCSGSNTIVENMLTTEMKGADSSKYWVEGKAIVKLFNIMDYKILNKESLVDETKQYDGDVNDYYNRKISELSNEVNRLNNLKNEWPTIKEKIYAFENIKPLPDIKLSNINYVQNLKGCSVENFIEVASMEMKMVTEYIQYMRTIDDPEAKKASEEAMKWIEYSVMNLDEIKYDAKKYRHRFDNGIGDTNRFWEWGDQFKYSVKSINDWHSFRTKFAKDIIAEFENADKNISELNKTIADIEKDKRNLLAEVRDGCGVLYSVRIKSTNKGGEPVEKIWRISTVKTNNNKWAVSYIFDKDEIRSKIKNEDKILLVKTLVGY